MRLKPKTPMDYHNAEQPDAVLADLEAKHGSSPTIGSEAKPTSIAEWFRYLTETGNFNAYQCDGSAKSAEIEAGFAAWKAAQGEKAFPLGRVRLHRIVTPPSNSEKVCQQIFSDQWTQALEGVEVPKTDKLEKPIW